MTAGPITINNGSTVTISNGGAWAPMVMAHYQFNYKEYQLTVIRLRFQLGIIIRCEDNFVSKLSWHSKPSNPEIGDYFKFYNCNSRSLDRR